MIVLSGWGKCNFDYSHLLCVSCFGDGFSSVSILCEFVRHDLFGIRDSNCYDRPRKVKVGNDQEMAQSVRNSHSKTPR